MPDDARPVSQADQPALPLFDAEALDIADYLKSEKDADADIHRDETTAQGLAALTLGAVWVVYGDIGTSPIYTFREAMWATGAAVPGLPEVLGILLALFLVQRHGTASVARLFGPICVAWFGLVLPALVLNYLGQGAMVLAEPEKAENSFFAMAPEPLLPVLVLLATAATVIASKAVITGAYSMARGAIQLGFLPRLSIRHMAEGQSGQIYIGAVNWLLLIGVLWLVMSFGSSSALASAYGIAVTGTMVLTTILGVLYLIRSGRLPYATAEERATVEPLGGCFIRVVQRFGFMETPNVSRAMAHARRAGLKFDVMASTFFLGRWRAVATGSGVELAMDRIYVALARLAADPTDFYHLPRDRVLELGKRVAI